MNLCILAQLVIEIAGRVKRWPRPHSNIKHVNSTVSHRQDSRCYQFIENV